MTWPVAFALTVLIEGAVLWLLFRQDQPGWRIGAVALVASGLTHPVVFLMLPRLFASYGPYLIVAELFAFMAEIPVLWAGLRPQPWYRAISASALANGASYLAGLGLHAALA